MASDNQIIAEIIVEGVDKFKADLKGAQGSVESLNSAIEKTGTESKEATSEATKSFESFRTQLKGMTSELTAMNLQLAEMKDAGKAGTKEFTDLEKKMSDLQKKAGNLKDAMGDAAEQIKAAGSDTSGLDKAIRAVSTATAAFQVFEGAAVLAGKGNEDLQKALVKLNAVMAITQGLQQIQNELVRQDSVFKKMASAATAAYNVVVGQSTGALKLFRIALAATGIGLAIVGIAALVENWDKLKSAIFGATYNLDEFNKKLEEGDEFIKGRTKSQEREILEMEKAGKTEEQIAKKRIEFAKENVSLGRERMSQLAEELQKTKSNSKEEKSIQEEIKKQQDVNFNAEMTQIKAEIALQKIYTKETKDAANEKSAIVKGSIEWYDLEIARIEDQIKKVKINSEAYQDLQIQLVNIRSEYEKLFKLGEDQKPIETEITLDPLKYKKQIKDLGLEPVEVKVTPTKLQTREQELQEMFEKAQNYYGLIQNTISDSLSLISNATAIRAENEIAALEKKRQRGLITEKQYEKEVAKIKNEAAQKRRSVEIANAVALIPQAVLQAYIAGLSVGGPAAPIVAGILAGVAGAFAAAQVGIIAASPLPKFREGGSVAKRLGLIRGKSHEQGGVPIEVEGDEFVMSKKAVKHYGVDFMDRVNKMKLNPVVTMQAKMDHIKNTDYKLYEHLATLGGYMKQDYRANENGNNILLGIKEALKRNNTYV